MILCCTSHNSYLHYSCSLHNSSHLLFLVRYLNLYSSIQESANGQEKGMGCTCHPGAYLGQATVVL